LLPSSLDRSCSSPRRYRVAALLISGPAPHHRSSVYQTTRPACHSPNSHFSRLVLPPSRPWPAAPSCSVSPVQPCLPARIPSSCPTCRLIACALFHVTNKEASSRLSILIPV
jgi:hypothetical protein